MIRNGLEPGHLLVVFAVIILVFGGKKLPELARGMGQGLRIFRTELKAVEHDESTEAGAPTPAVAGDHAAGEAAVSGPVAQTADAPKV